MAAFPPRFCQKLVMLKEKQLLCHHVCGALVRKALESKFFARKVAMFYILTIISNKS